MQLLVQNLDTLVLFIVDKMGIASALVRTAGMAVGNQEIFMEDGQAVAITLEAAGTELRRCRNVAENYLQRKADSGCRI